jgi:kynureninase
MDITRGELWRWAEQADRDDPLAAFRRRFDIPDGLVYLDGNSLGALHTEAHADVAHVVANEWGRGLIRSWNDADWINAPTRIGDKIARLLGASPGEVVVTDSTSVNIFKLLAAALRARPERRVIVSEVGNFPADLYVAQGLVELLGDRYELRLVDESEVPAALDSDVAVLMLTQVDYRTGRLLDMADLTKLAHEHGAMMLWDLCHSAGAVEVDLESSGTDLAVGCGYKYLNGGPGAPAFIYVRGALQNELRSPIQGWMGDARPFAMLPTYTPSEGIRRFLSASPSIIAMAALEAAIDMWTEVDMTAMRRKAVALTELFIELTSPLARSHGVVLASPSDPEIRGNQVALRHDHAYEVMQALAAEDVIGDCRPPNIMRFGFAPLYVRYVDVVRAADALSEVLESGAWLAPEYQAPVTARSSLLVT